MTDKMKLFVSEYLKDFNATQAAIRAGYSEDTAYSIGWENLRKPEIAEAINKYIDIEITDTNKILVENIKFWEKIRDNAEIQEASRLKASEHLAKYNNMFTDRIQHTTIDDEGNQTGILLSLQKAYDKASKDSDI